MKGAHSPDDREKPVVAERANLLYVYICFALKSIEHFNAEPGITSMLPHAPIPVEPSLYQGPAVETLHETMETFEMSYFWENIPIPSKTEYMKCLLEKIESLIKRMRWKAHLFLNVDSDASESGSDTENEN